MFKNILVAILMALMALVALAQPQGRSKWSAEMLEAKRAAESDEAKQSRQDAEEKHRATTCYVSWGGEFYHENPTCPGLEGDRNLEEMTIGKAIDGGYAPCQLCTY